LQPIFWNRRCGGSRLHADDKFAARALSGSELSLWVRDSDLAFPSRVDEKTRLAGILKRMAGRFTKACANKGRAVAEQFGNALRACATRTQARGFGAVFSTAKPTLPAKIVVIGNGQRGASPTITMLAAAKMCEGTFGGRG
jgi:hypothetical protein